VVELNRTVAVSLAEGTPWAGLELLGPAAGLAASRRGARSARRVIVKAVFVDLLNPKLTIFFLAFLPQFVPSHARHKLAGLLLLSGTFMP
jgi:threonine/homoserine/homoserine lactone efflux protein